MKKLNFLFTENTQNLVLKNLKCERRGTERTGGRKSCISRGQWWHKQRTWENHGGTKEKEEIASKEKRETVWGQCDRGCSGWTQNLQESYFLKGILSISAGQKEKGGQAENPTKDPGSNPSSLSRLAESLGSGSFERGMTSQAPYCYPDCSHWSSSNFPTSYARSLQEGTFLHDSVYIRQQGAWDNLLPS